MNLVSTIENVDLFLIDIVKHFLYSLEFHMKYRFSRSILLTLFVLWLFLLFGVIFKLFAQDETNSSLGSFDSIRFNVTFIPTILPT